MDQVVVNRKVNDTPHALLTIAPGTPHQRLIDVTPSHPDTRDIRWSLTHTDTLTHALHRTLTYDVGGATHASTYSHPRPGGGPCVFTQEMGVFSRFWANVGF